MDSRQFGVATPRPAVPANVNVGPHAAARLRRAAEKLLFGDRVSVIAALPLRQVANGPDSDGEWES